VTVRTFLASLALAVAVAVPAIAATSDAPVVRTLLTADDVPDAVSLTVPRPLGLAAFERQANTNPADRREDMARLRKAGFETAAIIHILTNKERGIDAYSVKVRLDAAAGLARDEAISTRDDAPDGTTISMTKLESLPAANVLTVRTTTGKPQVIGVAVIFARGPYVGLVGVSGKVAPPRAYVVKLARLMDARIRAVR
jgi:hypothetical protein